MCEKKLKEVMELNDLKQKKNHQGLKMHLALIVQVAIVAHCGKITKSKKTIFRSQNVYFARVCSYG